MLNSGESKNSYIHVDQGAHTGKLLFISILIYSNCIMS